MGHLEGNFTPVLYIGRTSDTILTLKTVTNTAFEQKKPTWKSME